jgi:XTP/dITP diphosphohydrolase
VSHWRVAAASNSKPPRVVRGRIAAEPRGTNGFGYDPLFFYPPFNCTLAELDQARKAVSHRGQAFRALRAHFDAR